MRPIERKKNYSFKAAQEVLSGGTRFSLGSGFSELKAPLQQGAVATVMWLTLKHTWTLGLHIENWVCLPVSYPTSPAPGLHFFFFFFFCEFLHFLLRVISPPWTTHCAEGPRLPNTWAHAARSCTWLSLGAWLWAGAHSGVGRSGASRPILTGQTVTRGRWT